MFLICSHTEVLESSRIPFEPCSARGIASCLVKRAITVSMGRIGGRLRLVGRALLPCASPKAAKSSARLAFAGPIALNGHR